MKTSIRRFAERLGVSHTAVRKAIENGRLEESIGYEHGRPFIADAVLAAREWRANRDPSKVR